MSIKQTIFNAVSDLVSDFMYYDRKEDEQLGRGDIEEAIKNNEISVDEIVGQFRSELIKGLIN